MFHITHNYIMFLENNIHIHRGNTHKFSSEYNQILINKKICTRIIMIGDICMDTVDINLKIMVSRY